MNIREQFKIEFDPAFNWLKLSSERGKDLQVDLVLINDALGGLLYIILKYGSCDFVFQNGKTGCAVAMLRLSRPEHRPHLPQHR